MVSEALKNHGNVRNLGKLEVDILMHWVGGGMALRKICKHQKCRYYKD